MIQFDAPSISFTLSDYMEIVDLWENCSSCVGFCVLLGQKFFSVRTEEIDDSILPMLTKSSDGLIARVLPSYAILYWYCKQVSNVS